MSFLLGTLWGKEVLPLLSPLFSHNYVFTVLKVVFVITMLAGLIEAAYGAKKEIGYHYSIGINIFIVGAILLAIVIFL